MITTKTRLSKLQENLLYLIEKGYKDFYNHIESKNNNPRSLSASISRSLKNLKQKGLIDFDLERHNCVLRISNVRILNVNKTAGAQLTIKKDIVNCPADGQLTISKELGR